MRESPANRCVSRAELAARPGSTCRARALTTAGIVGVVMAMFLATARAGSVDTADERFLDGLRQRRLFDLAEGYCRGALAGSDLPDDRRLRLVVEWSQTLIEHGLYSPPAERAARFDEAYAVAARALEAQPDQPRAVVLQVQLGLVRLAHGELARQEAELLGLAEDRVELARGELRAAIAQLRDVSAILDEWTRRAPRAAARDPSALSPAERYVLANNVRFQLARAYRNQGQCYPPQSLDRLNALRQAAELLGPLAQLDASERLAWPSRLGEVFCFRLLGEYELAARRLDLLESMRPPPDIASEATAERIRLALAEGDVSAALKAAADGRASREATSGEFDLATLEAFLAAWRSSADAGRSEEADRWQEKAAEVVAAIERTHGAYWSRRAEMLLAVTVAGSASVDNMSVLIGAADGLYRSGQLDEALAAYDRAGEQARAAARVSEAFDAAFKAAALEQQRGHHAQAAARFLALARAMPNDDRSADAHLLAVFNAAQVDDNRDARAMPQYVELLEEHVAQWPSHTSTNQARVWLGKLHQSAGRWSEAIASFRAVSGDHPVAPEALDRAGECYESWLAQLRSAGSPTAPVADEAITLFERVAAGNDAGATSGADPVRRQAALRAARLAIEFAPGRYSQAEQWLTTAMATADEAPDDWKAAAQAWLVVALAGQGRSEEAARRLDALAAGTPQTVLAMIRALGDVAQRSPPELRAQLAELQLRAAGLLPSQGAGLTEAQRREISRSVAEALFNSGRSEEGLRTLAALAAANPHDGDLQEAYAARLVALGNDAQLDEALSAWREVERKSHSGSDRWFRAKLALAEIHFRQGDKEQAAKIITLTQLLHPELGGPEMKRHFDELLSRCRP